MSEILSEREVNKFCNAPGRAAKGGLRVYDSHEALRAENTRLRRELEFVKTGGVAWCERAEAAEALTQWAEQSGQHPDPCHRHQTMADEWVGDCTCGLSAILGEV